MHCGKLKKTKYAFTFVRCTPKEKKEKKSLHAGRYN